MITLWILLGGNLVLNVIWMVIMQLQNKCNYAQGRINNIHNQRIALLEKIVHGPDIHD